MRLSLAASSCVIGVAFAVACGTTSSTMGGDASPLGDGGCLEATPTQGAACDPAQALCNPGDLCCGGEWTCDPNKRTWSLVQGGCACIVDSGVPQDAAADVTTTDAGPFSCGSLTCNGRIQYCFVEYSPIPDAGTTYACLTPDSGPPSCMGMSTATTPGACGCYESPSGEVTIAFCPP